MIATLACYKGSLPQGSPCSSILAHIGSGQLDKELSKLASSCDCRYSRYVDDITFSSNSLYFPSVIAFRVRRDSANWTIGHRLLEIVEGQGFQFKTIKTRMHLIGNRQQVTGLIINRKVNVSKEFRHLTRSMAHTLFKTGEYRLNASTAMGFDTSVPTSDLRSLEGMFSYIHHIDSLSTTAPNSSRSKLYQRFIIYKYFYVGSKSLLVTSTRKMYQAATTNGCLDPFVVAGGSMVSSLFGIEFRYSRFYPSRACASALGISTGLPKMCLGTLLLILLQSYRTFKSIANERLCHLFLFDDIREYRYWMNMLSEEMRLLYPADVREGWIVGTNVFVGYHHLLQPKLQ
jgi:hypothetical protein